MANCYLIEKSLDKELKEPWYVESRLATKINTHSAPSKIKPTEFLPGTEVREVYVYTGYLWPGD